MENQFYPTEADIEEMAWREANRVPGSKVIGSGPGAVCVACEAGEHGTVNTELAHKIMKCVCPCCGGHKTVTLYPTANIPCPRCA